MKVHGARVLVLLDDQSKIVRGIERVSAPPAGSGTVLAHGEFVEFLEVGEKVSFHSFAGTTMSLDGRNCKLLDENDVLLAFGVG